MTLPDMDQQVTFTVHNNTGNYVQAMLHQQGDTVYWKYSLIPGGKTQAPVFSSFPGKPMILTFYMQNNNLKLASKSFVDVVEATLDTQGDGYIILLTPYPDDFPFLEILGIAVSRVLALYPYAAFGEADGNPEGGGGTTSGSVKKWRFIFRNQGNSAVEIDYDDGIFLVPVEIDHPWVDGRIINIPVERSLTNAIELIHNAGFNDPFSAVALRYPLFPGVTEPSYIFTLPAQNVYVFVGLDTGSVSTAPIS